MGGLFWMSAVQAEAVIQLSSLDGSSGFRLDGVADRDRSGRAVSNAGDINGDGIDDVIVGANEANPNDSNAGSSYVVFGRSAVGFASTVNLSTLNGSNGFRLDGAAAGDSAGQSVSNAGDVNGDGIDDLIIGASGTDSSGSNAGSSYVVFGRSAAGFASVINLSTLNGSDGFRLDGAAAGNLSGSAVSAAGDLNGDGIDDLIIGAFNAGNGSGSSYLVFGRSAGGFASIINLSTLDGSTGFRLDGVSAQDRSGFAVSAAGDINGDGIDDLIIGAYFADPNGLSNAGSSYVVFGSTGFVASAVNLSTLDGNTGFRLDGIAQSDFSGRAVSAAGDINGDGIDDLIVGAPYSSSDASYSGSSYVVFGRSAGGFASTINLSTLDGSTGFRLDGRSVGDLSGSSVSSAGDINGDGVDDLIIGAPSRTPALLRSGESHVVFGRRSGGFASTISLSTLDGRDGFRLDGVANEDQCGAAVSGAGDINGDGVDDLIIGAPFASSNGNVSGSSYVVFGARERIFRDGNEAQNIEVFYPRLDVRNGFIGSAVRWQNGATCNCDDPPFDFNLYNTAGNLAFFWPAAADRGGVADGSGSAYALLQPGAVVGPASTFLAAASSAATANWRAGADAYLGFRFVNASGRINYGYARIRSTAPTGYPVEVVDVGVNITGLAVTIPTP